VLAYGELPVKHLDEDIRVHCVPDGEMKVDFAPALNNAWGVGPPDLHRVSETLDREASSLEMES